MKYAQYFQYSDDTPKDVLELQVEKCDKDARSNISRLGLKIISSRARHGLMNEDFQYAIKTCVVEYYCFKACRIISKPQRRKLKFYKHITCKK
jgi:hypothetical protein